MSEYLEAFSLGNAAFIGNVCMLPLSPGRFVMMANRASDERGARSLRWRGRLVFAGVVASMVLIGFVLHQIGRSVADILDWLLPLTYGAVLVLGVAMVLGRNPFARLATTQAPVLRSPSATAFVYGMALAPMTLPCTGPLIISAFVVGGVSGSGALAESLAYFVWFAMGFGWPLALLPLLAAPVQRRVTRFLALHHHPIAVASGLLLIAIAVIGYWNDVRPAWS
ncbi:MAG: cytochrome c biogenesis CcdA family protein [Acidimicrobiia bacterium]